MFVPKLKTRRFLSNARPLPARYPPSSESSLASSREAGRSATARAWSVLSERE